MLILRRKVGEKLLIAGDIEIEILEMNGSQVKLGIKAPKDISVLRQEVQITMEQNRAASALAGSLDGIVSRILRA
jgi:carbon storage regulator